MHGSRRVFAWHTFARRAFSWRAAGLAALLALTAAAAAGADTPARRDRVVNVYNWSDYIEPTVLDAFTRETGIRVRYDTFDSNDTLETKLLAGKSGYDVVVPTGNFLQRQIKAGVFQKLDKTKLPHLSAVWPVIAKHLAVYDPGNEYAVNYMWGTVGIGYNVKRAGEALLKSGAGAARDAVALAGQISTQISTWNTVFGAGELMKFKDCGVHMLDSADDILPAALHYLGRNPNSTDPGDLEKAADLVAKVRPAVRKFHSSEYLNALASGEICLVVGWSGDIKQAQKRAAEARNGVVISYAVPKEGAQMFFDNLAIPRDTPSSTTCCGPRWRRRTPTSCPTPTAISPASP
jgi:putrescine transport system substrate-binding protein